MRIHTRWFPLLEDPWTSHRWHWMCVGMVWGAVERVAVLLLYHSPSSPVDTLLRLAEAVSEWALYFPWLLVLGDFNVYADIGQTGAASDFMLSMAAMGLFPSCIGTEVMWLGKTMSLVGLQLLAFDGVLLSKEPRDVAWFLTSAGQTGGHFSFYAKHTNCPPYLAQPDSPQWSMP